MQSRIMKGITLTIITLALPVVAFAQTSRIAGMGTQGDYVKDYTNMFSYPSYVSQVGNLVYGEFGTVTNYDDMYTEYFTTEDRSVGAVLGNLWDGKYGTWAFHLREYQSALGTNFAPTLDGYYYGYGNDFGSGFETYNPFYGYITDKQGIDPDLTHDQAFDIMWGKKINNLNVGLRFNRSYYKEESKNPNYTNEGWDSDSRNVTGFGGGLGFTINPNATADIGLLYESRTFKFDDGAGNIFQSDGGGAYLASGRVMWQWKPNVLVVPVIRMYSFDTSTKTTDNETGTPVTTTEEAKVSGWQAGFAGNWTLNQNDLFVCGVTFASNTWDYSTTQYKFTESIMPTLFASLETHVNSWWTLRFGGRKGVFYSAKYEYNGSTPAQEYTESYSPFQFFMGTGVKLGTLQLDATLAQDFFHNPASYLTNSNNYYVPLFPKVTATYTF